MAHEIPSLEDLLERERIISIELLTLRRMGYNSYTLQYKRRYAEMYSVRRRLRESIRAHLEFLELQEQVRLQQQEPEPLPDEEMLWDSASLPFTS